MRTAPIHVATALVCTMLVLGGCNSPDSNGDSAAGSSAAGSSGESAAAPAAEPTAAEPTAAESADGWWTEEHHDGRGVRPR